MFNFILIFIFISGCAFFSSHKEAQNVPEKDITVGVIKKEIKVGMSSADVVQALGSPNIITRDSKGREVWVYDRIYAETETRTDSQYGTILVLGFFSSNTKTIKTQKTLTLIITFDNEKVESFSYHYSKF